MTAKLRIFPCILFWCLVVRLALAAPGDVDLIPPDLQIPGGDRGHVMVAQPDGKIIIAGEFTSVLGVPRSSIARLNADGTLDTGFNPNPDGTIFCLAAQKDGKVIIGGSFTTLQPNGAALPTTRNRIARLNPDGTLDTGFDPNAEGSVYCLAVQSDGKVLIGGSFTTLQPNGAPTPTLRIRVARLNADGTLDTGFDPRVNSASSAVFSLAVQPNGKILIGGEFRSLQPNGAASPTTRNGIARVEADGALDTGFNPNPQAGESVMSVALQADGKVLLGGTFLALQPNGAATGTPRSNVARVNGDGTLDMSFDPSADWRVDSMTVQADGKVLLAGSFTSFQPNGAASPTTRNRIARLNPDGTLDTGFDPNADIFSTGIGLQADGKVLFAGFFSTLQPNGAVSATSRKKFARLFNDPATQILSAPTATQALWQRGGAAPDVSSVTFELSTDNGVNWLPLGSGTRVGTSPDWQLTGLSLPSSGTLRAVGRTMGGRFNGSSGLIEQVSTIQRSGPEPEIAVRGNATTIANGDATPSLTDHTDFGGPLLAGETVTRTFTIANWGSANLTFGTVTVGGTHAANFTVTSQPASPVGPGGSSTFQVRFAPDGAGPRSATLSFSNNDSDESSFSFSIRGPGTAPEINLSGNSTQIAAGDATPSPSDHTDFGTTGLSGWTVVRTFTISNSGTESLTIGTIAVGGPHLTDFNVTPPAVSTIAPGASTTFLVTFDPSALGTRSATLSFSTNDSDENPFHFSIQGTGAASIPEISVSGSSVDIPNGSASTDPANGTNFTSTQIAGGTVTRFFTITNPGFQNLTIGTVTIGGVHLSDFTVNQQPASTVIPGGSTTFQLTFDPSDGGPRSATVSFPTNDADENPFNFSISGGGLAPTYPEIAITGNNTNIADGDVTPSPSDHTDFGTIAVTGAIVTRTFTIFNSGTGFLTVNLLTVSGENEADFTIAAAPNSTINPGASSTFLVRFDPSGTGLRTATISLSTNDADEHPFNFALQGIGTAPEITVTGNGADIGTGDTTPTTSDHTDFGSILISGQTVTRTFTIANLGTASLTLGSVSIAGTNPEDFSVTEAPAAAVSEGSSTTLKIRFAPMTAGSREATLSFATNDPGENPFTFAIVGNEPTTDTDSNGFTDAEEAGIAGLRTRYAVGETVDLDLSFLRLSGSQSLAVTGLPLGVVYNPLNRRIEGTIRTELGDTPGEIRRITGATIASRPFHLTVVPYSFLGGFEALLESGALPVGKARLTITGPGVFSATLERQGQTSRTARGTFTTSGSGTQSVPVTFPFFRGFPETLVTFVVPSTSDLVTGTNEGATLRGFRLAKPGRSPSQRVTIAFENTVPGNRTTTPAGTGFASGSLNSAGLLSLTASLGDGQAATIGLNLSQTHQAVVFVQPYPDKAQAFFGGILTIGDLGAPGRGRSTESQTASLQWRKAQNAASLSYPGGFGPLAVNGRVSKWIPVTTAEGLALSLGLNLRQIDVRYVVPPAGAVPSQLALRNTFSMVRLLPTNALAWTGKATPATGTFSGSLAKNPVAGVLLQDASFGTQVGVGLVRMPVTGTGLPRGSFETAGIRFDNN